MKDRADVQRAKARSMMGGDLATAAAQRKTMGSEMGAKPETVVGRVAKGPDDRYVRPGAPIQTERPSVMLAKGGKVPPAVPRARMAQAMAKKAESKGEQRMEMRKDMRQDKKAIAGAVHKHERHLHKGQPLTKLKDGGKVKKPDERDVIDFTGEELTDIEKSATDHANRMQSATKDPKWALEQGRLLASGRSLARQSLKGKSDEAASDAADVMRERVYAKGGKVKCMAAGGAAKVRQGWGQKVPKSPRGGNPQY